MNSTKGRVAAIFSVGIAACLAAGCGAAGPSQAEYDARLRQAVAQQFDSLKAVQSLLASILAPLPDSLPAAYACTPDSSLGEVLLLEYDAIKNLKLGLDSAIAQGPADTVLKRRQNPIAELPFPTVATNWMLTRNMFQKLRDARLALAELGAAPTDTLGLANASTSRLGNAQRAMKEVSKIDAFLRKADFLVLLYTRTYKEPVVRETDYEPAEWNGLAAVIDGRNLRLMCVLPLSAINSEDVEFRASKDSPEANTPESLLPQEKALLKNLRESIWKEFRTAFAKNRGFDAADLAQIRAEAL